MNRLEEIRKRKAELKAALGKDDADLDAIEKELDELEAEEREIVEKEEKRQAMLERVANGEGKPAAGAGMPGETSPEQRAAEEFFSSHKMKIDAAQTRATLLSGGTLATPTKVSGINDLPGGVCSILDLVTVEDCTGMSADKVAYISADSVAGVATEGQYPASGGSETSSEPTFDYITISPESYDIVSFVSNEISRQSPLNYTEKVKASAFKALRKKVAKKITDKVAASTIADEIIMSSIGADTLRKIAFNYGPDDEVSGGAVLFLNKTDLVAFGDVRGTNEKKAIYEITPDSTNPNMGTIKEGGLTVRYCINPDCTPLTGTTNPSTTATLPTMFYGDPKTVKLDLFGETVIKTSEDFKLTSDMLTIYGKASAGSDLVVKGGMLKISLAKAQ